MLEEKTHETRGIILMLWVRFCVFDKGGMKLGMVVWNVPSF